ncbi:MAG: hypothetical protein C0456_17560 [Hyphomonas sp.]|uniref:esterase-like activity of phytase family protein n=1 Tax=Hyphomonas sp. TaxID=87 RepID=UPI001E0EB654|nr:esterase-like activity of phytase family protein [Hyphomonas sp.]MBA4228419.1 hypothetical protein [Hyphomonas sp.]
MRFRAPLTALIAAGFLVTCAGPEEVVVNGAPVVADVRQSPELSETVHDLSPEGAVRDGLWRASDHAGALAAASCPPGTKREAPLPVDLTATPVSVGEAAQIARRIPETVSISGAWELASPNSNVGGLSGLALLPASEGGGLLSVSDAGAFVWIDLENGAPSGAKISYMQGSDGAMLTGKTEGDAEGLVWSEGLALVSFERSFRIEAFALSTCGSAARAARVANLPGQHNGRNIDENQGPEALYLEADGALGFGYEGMLGTSPLGRVLADGTAEWTGNTAPAPSLHGLVGREIVPLPDGPARTVEMFRAWDPLQGNRIRLTWGTGADETLTLSRPLLVDNFEGIAAEALSDQLIRVWIVSDNNFSASQKTLLYALDIRITQN